ncbi:hypothetical protein J6590_029800 [Homalodisca vitripennis]|nr:hypothetical protein J6590_029800 [Homalodisca vitripennis]
MCTCIQREVTNLGYGMVAHKPLPSQLKARFVNIIPNSNKSARSLKGSSENMPLEPQLQSQWARSHVHRTTRHYHYAGRAVLRTKYHSSRNYNHNGLGLTYIVQHDTTATLYCRRVSSSLGRAVLRTKYHSSRNYNHNGLGLTYIVQHDKTSASLY